MKATLKRALSVLCALALCIGLLPVSALAAESSNDYIKFEYSYGAEAVRTDMTVYVQDEYGNELGTPIVLNDFYSGVVTHVNITCLDSQYEIMSVEHRSGSASITSPKNEKSSYSCDLYSAGGGAITVTLCEPFKPPVIIGEINRTSVGYRIYDNQVLKMLAASGVPVSETTSIGNVNVVFVKSFWVGQEQVRAQRRLQHCRPPLR